MNDKVKKEVYFADEKHVWIDGNQYIRLDRFLEMQDNIRIETGMLHNRCVKLEDENKALKKLLKSNLSTEGGPEYE